MTVPRRCVPTGRGRADRPAPQQQLRAVSSTSSPPATATGVSPSVAAHRSPAVLGAPTPAHRPPRQVPDTAGGGGPADTAARLIVPRATVSDPIGPSAGRGTYTAPGEARQAIDRYHRQHRPATRHERPQIATTSPGHAARRIGSEGGSRSNEPDVAAGSNHHTTHPSPRPLDCCPMSPGLRTDRSPSTISRNYWSTWPTTKRHRPQGRVRDHLHSRFSPARPPRRSPAIRAGEPPMADQKPTLTLGSPRPAAARDGLLTPRAHSTCMADGWRCSALAWLLGFAAANTSWRRGAQGERRTARPAGSRS